MVYSIYLTFRFLTLKKLAVAFRLLLPSQGQKSLSPFTEDLKLCCTHGKNRISLRVFPNFFKYQKPNMCLIVNQIVTNLGKKVLLASRDKINFATLRW